MFHFIVSLLFYILVPQHDFHTSWMNLTFNEKNNQFEVSWRTDTEHLEGVLTSFSGMEIKLENTSIGEFVRYEFKDSPKTWKIRSDINRPWISVG